MSFNAKQIKPASNPNRKRPDPLEPGSYPARLVQIVGLGIQPGKEYKGETKPPRLTIRLTYEFLDEFLKDEDGNDIADKPRWLSEELPFLSLKADRAKSTKRYYALDPDDKADGDWAKLISAPCILNIINETDKRPGNNTVYEKISNVSTMRPKEAAKAPELVNPPLVWDFYDPDVEVFKNFPDWIQEKIKGAVDYPGSALERVLEGTSVQPKTSTTKKKEEPVEASDETDSDEENW